jgi:hypothetical protein
MTSGYLYNWRVHLYICINQIYIILLSKNISTNIYLFRGSGLIVHLYRGCQLIGGGGRSIWRNPPSSRKWLTSFILIHICMCMYSAQYGPSKYYLPNRNYVYMSNETVYGLSQRCTINPHIFTRSICEFINYVFFRP